MGDILDPVLSSNRRRRRRRQSRRLVLTPRRLKNLGFQNIREFALLYLNRKFAIIVKKEFSQTISWCMLALKTMRLNVSFNAFWSLIMGISHCQSVWPWPKTKLLIRVSMKSSRPPVITVSISLLGWECCMLISNWLLTSKPCKGRRSNQLEN